MAKGKRRRKWFIIGAVVIVAVIVGIVTMGNSEQEGTQVQADLAVLDAISEKVTASGRVEPQTKVDITAEVSAQIREVYVREGDLVVQGQALLLLDTVQYTSDVSQVRYSLDEVKARTSAARTQYEKDKLEFERQKKLFEQGLTSENDFTDARFAYESAEASYHAMQAQSRTAQAALDKATDNLSKTLIRSPMDGVITYLNAEAGEVAQAQTSFTQGKTLMTIADLSVFEVEVDVDETEIAKLMQGQSADIRVDAFRDTTFDGTVIEIGNSAMVQGEGTESYSTSFRVKVRIDDLNAGFRPGMSATVDITTARLDEAVLVPYAAVVTREVEKEPDEEAEKAQDSDTTNAQYASSGGSSGANADSEDATTETDSVKSSEKVKKSGVFLIRDGVATFSAIETGIADEQNIVARSGVQPGDTVISGSFRTLRELSDGDQVSIEERSIEAMNEDSE